MSGGGALIFFGSIKPFTLDCAYKKWGFLMFMRISPGWLRAPLSGFTNFSQSPLVLPRKQMTKLDLQSRVTLSGAKSQREVRQRLAAANVFVLPSVVDPDGGMDNLPTVIMEAMATGLPVVSTAIGGIPEMVIEDETGFLVKPGDVSAMADAIENVISDCSSAARLGLS